MGINSSLNVNKLKTMNKVFYTDCKIEMKW